MNWEDLRYFLSIARAGTLSGAAKQLKVDQTTVSRRLVSLESELDVQLVVRLPRKSMLTPAGKLILAEASAIEARALQAERIIHSLKSPERSRVAISTPPILARHFFAPALNRLSQRHSDLLISIQSEPFLVSLSRLEADISVRLSAAVEESDIVRIIGKMHFGLYCHCDYASAGQPDAWEYIAYNAKEPDFAHKSWLHALIGERRVACEVTDLSNQYEAACSGIGVAGLPCFLGDSDPRLNRLGSHHSMFCLDIWIAKHPDRRNDQRLRKLTSSIEAELQSCGLGLD